MINARVVAKIADGVIRGWLLIERKMKLEAIHDSEMQTQLLTGHIRP